MCDRDLVAATHWPSCGVVSQGRRLRLRVVRFSRGSPHPRRPGGFGLGAAWSSACPRCPLKAQCTTGDYRRIARWEHEAVLEAMQERLDQQPDAMKLRRQTAEHPFGTLKAWMGATHFLTKRLPRVRTEMSLHVLAYNLKRVVQIVGIGPLMQAIQA